jgi:exodeoxyribonuclease-5
MPDFINKVAKYGGYGFTPDQEEALDLLDAWYRNPKDLLFTLSGRAGTGKTYLLKCFIDDIVKHPICVSAPTHKAVRQVERSTGRKGKTLQSLHGLKPNVNLEDFDLNNVKFDQLGNPTMNNYKIVVIDECSMVNIGLHDLNIRRARDLGIKLLYVGDPKQLPPVSKNNESDADISPTFNVKNHYELTEIIRQASDNPLTELLELVVKDVDNETNNFISYLLKNPIQVNSNGEGYKVYNSMQDFVTSAIDCFKSDEFSKDPDYGRIAAWKNDTVMGYNTVVRNAVSAHFNGGVPTTELIDLNDLLIGYKTITDEFNETVIINSEDYVVNRVIPRMSEGGFKSYAVTIMPRHGGRTVDVDVVDYRDKSFLVYYELLKRKYFNAKYSTYSNRSAKWKTYYKYKDNHLTLFTFPIKEGDTAKAYVTKDLDYAFSLTVHKLQGSTIQNTFVDLNDMLYYSTGRLVENSSWHPGATTIRNKLIYTAISRTSKFCNIYLNLK